MTADLSSANPAAVVTSVQHLLLGVGKAEAFLQELTEIAARVVPQTSSGITVPFEGGQVSAASSDLEAEALDQAQSAVGQGPAIHCMHAGAAVLMTDLDRDGRWPRYLAVARERGLRSSLTLPMYVGQPRFAVMTIYSFESSHAFEGTSRHHLELVAAQAAGALQLASQRIRETQFRTQLDQALASRTVIDQALGILMGQHGCTSATAFTMLRRQAQGSRRRLQEEAGDLIARVTGEAPRLSPSQA